MEKDSQPHEQSRRAGTFSLSDREVYGELVISDRNSSVILHSDDSLGTLTIPAHCIYGTLLDKTKVSLLHCLKKASGSQGHHGREVHYFADVYPQFIVEGEKHLDPTEKTISDIFFVVDDAHSIFHDDEAFGGVIDSEAYIEEIAHANDKRLDLSVELA